MIAEAREGQRLAALQEALLQGQPITVSAKRFVDNVLVEPNSSVSVQSTMPTEALLEDVAQSGATPPCVQESHIAPPSASEPTAQMDMPKPSAQEQVDEPSAHVEAQGAHDSQDPASEIVQEHQKPALETAKPSVQNAPQDNVDEDVAAKEAKEIRMSTTLDDILNHPSPTPQDQTDADADAELAKKLSDDLEIRQEPVHSHGRVKHLCFTRRKGKAVEESAIPSCKQEKLLDPAQKDEMA